MAFSVKEKTAIDVAAYAQQYGISHEQASEEIQEFLLDNGFQWSSGRTDIAYTTAKYLQISPDFELTFSNVISCGYASITFTRKESISLVPNKVVRIIEINGKKYNEEDVLKAISNLEEYNA